MSPIEGFPHRQVQITPPQRELKNICRPEDADLQSDETSEEKDGTEGKSEEDSSPKGDVLPTASNGHTEAPTPALSSIESAGQGEGSSGTHTSDIDSKAVIGGVCKRGKTLAEKETRMTRHGPYHRVQFGTTGDCNMSQTDIISKESCCQPKVAFTIPTPPPPTAPLPQIGYCNTGDPLVELAYFTLLQQQQSQPSTVATASVPINTSEHVSDEETALRRVEGARSYAECRQLVEVYRHQAAALPSLLVELSMRLAFWGSREFKESLYAELRSISAAQKLQSSTVTAGKTKGGSVRVTDEHYEDFRHCMRSLLQDVQRVVECRRGSLSGSFMVKALRAFGQSRLATIETIRYLAAEAQQRLHQLKPSELVSLLQSYTQGLEVGADALGGINITVNDASFTKSVLQHLVLQQHLLKELTPREITGLLRCCDRLSLQDPQLFKYIGQLVLLKRSQFQSSEWASVVGVFTRMGIPLRGECEKTKRPKQERDWERPPPPKKPVPISKC